MNHNRIGANLNMITNNDMTNNFRPGPDENIVTDFGTHTPPLVCYRHLLHDRTIFTNLCKM